MARTHDVRVELAVGALLVATALTGCDGLLADSAAGPRGAPPRDGTDPPVVVDECRRPTQVTFEALRPTCEACHTSGSFPAFASLESFERLIAYEPRFVAPGNPEGSQLIALLEGNGTAPLDRMPPGSNTYVDLLAEGAATMSMDAIRTWVRELEACGETSDATDHPLSSRVRAEQIRNALEMQLGLQQSDVPEAYRLWNPTDIPPPETAVFGNGLSQYLARFDTSGWRSVGGPDHLQQDARSDQLDPSFVRTFVLIAQVWCRTSVERSEALFDCEGCAGRDARSDADLEGIRRTVRYQFDRLLAVEATDAEVDSMVSEIFLTYEPEGPRVAWAAVCSTFLRDPLWLTY